MVQSIFTQNLIGVLAGLSISFIISFIMWMVNNLFLYSSHREKHVKETPLWGKARALQLMNEPLCFKTSNTDILPPPKKNNKTKLVPTQLLRIWNKIQNAILHKLKVYTTLSQRWSLTFQGLLKQSAAYMCDRFKYADFSPPLSSSQLIYFIRLISSPMTAVDRNC